MRGPLGSLIAQLSNNCFQKRFPHRFLPSRGALLFIASRVPVGKVGDKDFVMPQLNGSKGLS